MIPTTRPENSAASNREDMKSEMTVIDKNFARMIAFLLLLTNLPLDLVVADRHDVLRV